MSEHAAAYRLIEFSTMGTSDESTPSLERLLTELRAANARCATDAQRPASAPPPGHISFAANGNSWPYRLFGWDNPEATHTWTIGTESFLRIPTPRHPEPLLINARITPFTSPSSTIQAVGIHVGDDDIAHWTVTCPGHYFCIVWPRLFQEPGLDLRFSIPDARSPQSEGMSDDHRMLGLMFHDLWLQPLTAVSI